MQAYTKMKYALKTIKSFTSKSNVESQFVFENQLKKEAVV